PLIRLALPSLPLPYTTLFRSSGDGRISQNPRNRYLTGRTTVFLTHLSQAFYQREIFRQLWFNKLDVAAPPIAVGEFCGTLARHRDRKSTRLNSSHGSNSYAVL